jgi:hypothetical protein
MSNADKYRAHARHCVIKAEQTQLTEGKLSWLRIAQTWLGMIPEAQRTADDAFQASVFEIAALDSLGGGDSAVATASPTSAMSDSILFNAEVP